MWCRSFGVDGRGRLPKEVKQGGKMDRPELRWEDCVQREKAAYRVLGKITTKGEQSGLPLYKEQYFL